MTDVDKLEGRELADAVAVEVMGFMCYRVAHSYIHARHEWLDPASDYHVDRGKWHPATDWADFGRVVDWVTELGVQWFMSHKPAAAHALPGEGPCWWGMVDGHYAHATDPKAAFLRAAVLAARAWAAAEKEASP